MTFNQFAESLARDIDVLKQFTTGSLPAAHATIENRYRKITEREQTLRCDLGQPLAIVQHDDGCIQPRHPGTDLQLQL